MKLDKETIIKHQFWFLLGTYLLVWLIAVLWLKFAAADPIEKAKKDYKETTDKLAASSRDPKNPNTFCPPWEAYGQVFDKHKQVIWKVAWDYQKPMFTWPAWPLESGLNSLGGEFVPQDEMSPADLTQFRRTLYNEEIQGLERDAAGNPKEKNSVGFLSPIELEGGFEAIMRPHKWAEMPTREEVWLAQEDFWVRRELLYDLARAVAYDAYMFPVEIDSKEAQPPDVVTRLRFRNQNWEITLLIKKDKDQRSLLISRDSTIKNVHPGGRTLTLASAKGEGIVFNVYHQNETTLNRFELKGEPVPSEQSVPFGSDYPLRDIRWLDKEKPPQMSQAFDWYTCPIRRIEALELGQQSCRTFTTAMKANETLSKLDPPREAPPDPNAPKDATTGGMTGNTTGGPSGNPMMGVGSMMMGGMGAMSGQGGTPPNVTPNNSIERNRYLQAPKEGDAPEKPSRHLPIAVAVIVDQSNMQDVLVALANSRLRIQVTQVDFRRLHGVKPFTDEEKKSSGGSETQLSGPVMGMGMMGGGGLPRMMGPRIGGSGSSPMGGSTRPPGIGSAGGGSSRMMAPPTMGGGSSGGRSMMMMMGGRMGGMPRPVGPAGMGMSGMMPGGITGSPTKVQDKEDENLVEMTVYGIATLYRRPDQPKTEGQPGQTAQPAPAGTAK